jgi:hypothetical protein
MVVDQGGAYELECLAFGQLSDQLDSGPLPGYKPHYLCKRGTYVDHDLKHNGAFVEIGADRRRR